MSGEDKSRKMFYSMSEVAEMFDVSQPLLRFWESKFDILKPHRNKKGNRMFTPEDIKNLKLIYHLVKERGMTLEGAKRMLKQKKEGMERDLEIIDRLMSIKAMLAEVRQSLGETAPEEGVREIIVDHTPKVLQPVSPEDVVELKPRIVEQTLF